MSRRNGPADQLAELTLKLGSGWIAGIIIGGILFLLIAIIGQFC